LRALSATEPDIVFPHNQPTSKTSTSLPYSTGQLSGSRVFAGGEMGCTSSKESRGERLALEPMSRESAQRDNNQRRCRCNYECQHHGQQPCRVFVVRGLCQQCQLNPFNHPSHQLRREGTQPGQRNRPSHHSSRRH